MAVSDYSTTAASNTSISGISLAENVMVPSDVNNAIRQMMADIKAGVPYLSGTSYLIESTDAGASTGPFLELYRNSASPAAADLIGAITFSGEDSGGNTTNYATILGRIDDPTDTTEDGSLVIRGNIAGTMTDIFYVNRNAASTNSAGTVGLPNGRLSFPATQSASSDANTLDDYEEGTFTPTVSAGSGSITTVGAVAGFYEKVGQLVTLTVTITITTNGTGASFLQVTNLPFTSMASAIWHGVGRNATTGAAIIGSIAASVTTLTMVTTASAYPIGSGETLTLTIAYRASA
jgi:hypothetical protein